MSARQQSGMALVAALFLIVVLASLGVFALRVGNSQQQAVTLSLLQARALAAANSGIEFGANRALKASNCAASTLLNLNQAALAGFTVRVTCTQTDHLNAVGPALHVYQLDAYAQRGAFGSSDYVFRHVGKTVAN